MRGSHVLITGCGYLGEALALRLHAEGHVVWALRRQTDRLPACCRRVEGDLRVPNTLRNLPRVDHVFHLADAPDTDEDALGGALADGARYLFGALSRARVRRVFVGSCMQVFGRDGGEWVDEDSDPAPITARGRLALEGERVAAKAPTPATSVRFGRIYGPGRLGLLADVLDGRAATPADLRVYDNLLHVEDAVEILRHLLHLKKPADLYCAVDREPVLRLDLRRHLSAALELAEPAIDGAAPDSGEPSCRGMSERLVESGYRFRHPSYAKGHATIVAAVRRTSSVR